MHVQERGECEVIPEGLSYTRTEKSVVIFLRAGSDVIRVRVTADTVTAERQDASRP